jgi:hypothetical protein
VTPREQAQAIILLREWVAAAKQLQITTVDELLIVGRLETRTNAFLEAEDTGAEAV